MLIIEIAIGVFGGLLLFWFFYKSSRKREKQREEQREADRRKNESDLAAVEDYKSDLRAFRGVEFNHYLEVFNGRLLTLEDDKDVSYKDVGIIELKLFIEHSNELMEKVREEEREAIVQRGCSDSLSLMLSAALNDFISTSRSVLQSYALKKFEDKVLEIAKKNGELDV